MIAHEPRQSMKKVTANSTVDTDPRFELLKEACHSIDDLNKFIDNQFPDGLDSKLYQPKNKKSMFYPGGAYIGFNLNRYLYSDELAAYCHAIHDTLLGKRGTSYWSDFQPNVKDGVEFEDTMTWEVWTG